MHTMIIKAIRPNTEVQFYNNPEFKEFILENWILTGKIIVGMDVSDDGLISTMYMEFTDEDAKNEWLANTVVSTYIETLKTYNESHNIQIERIIP